jgi:hypothetical protein
MSMASRLGSGFNQLSKKGKVIVSLLSVAIVAEVGVFVAGGFAQATTHH